MLKIRKSGFLWTIALLIILLALSVKIGKAQNVKPVADAGSSQYAGPDPIVLDGTGSYDLDNSGTLSFTWRQISGPTVLISDTDTATPTISGFVQTDEIQECEFELVISDGELKSRPDTAKVIIVPDFGENMLRLANDSFDPNKPTQVYFQGGDCEVGVAYPVAGIWGPDLLRIINVIDFHEGYMPDIGSNPRTYYGCGDMIIVYLSSVAPDYRMPIQTLGDSTGGQPAVDVGIRLNLTYRDARYAINRITLRDAGINCRNYENYSVSIADFVASSVDGEQCWLDNYVSKHADFYPNVLNVGFKVVDHTIAMRWYDSTWKRAELRNNFNHGVFAGVYWHVIGPGKNLQLASTPGVETYKFIWYGDVSSGTGYMDFYDEPNYPGRLPEPVTLVGPEDGAIVDANGAVLSCEESENAVGYQLLFGPDPYRVMDYYTASDTPSPPSEVITSSPFEQTWWTVKVYDQYGSTIYADPILANFESLDPPLVENITLGKRYGSVRHAIVDARNGHEIVVSPGVYKGNVNFKGKNLTVRSTNPNDPAITSETVITADGDVVTFSSGEDANCVLVGFTVTGGKRGIYCSGSSPIITNCNITGNVNAEIGAGMYLSDGSNPTVVNCIFSENSASMMGGGIQNVDSSPIFINCTFTGNSAAYFGGGIYCAGGSPVLTNCILWDNTPDEVSILGGTPAITYSDVQGGFAGEGNIDADPLFADADNSDFHLLASSPCIDSGDPSTPVGSEPSPNGGIINMGAYGGTLEASESP